MPVLPAERIPRPPVDGSFTGLYDSRMCAYNWHSANTRRLRASLAKAKAGTGRAHIAFIGDSTVAGQGAVRGTQSFPDVVRDTLAAAGYPAASTYSQARTHGTSNLDPRWTYGSGWATHAGNDSLLVTNGSTTNPLTFQSVATGTTVRVIYVGAGGSFTVSIDGGAAATVVANSSTTSSVEYTGLADTTHEVVIERVAATIYIQGVEIVHSTTGTRIVNAAWSGSKADHWSGTQWFEAGAALSGTEFPADCVFIGGLSINDSLEAVTVADWVVDLGEIITQLRTGNTPDIVLVHSTSEDNDRLEPYRAGLYGLADSMDLPLIDLSSVLGTHAEANGLGLMFDGDHPNAAGYSMAGTAVAALLTV